MFVEIGLDWQLTNHLLPCKNNCRTSGVGEVLRQQPSMDSEPDFPYLMWQNQMEWTTAMLHKAFNYSVSL